MEQHGTTHEAVEVRRNGGLAALLGIVAAVVAIAWLGRATASGELLDWVVAGAMAFVATGWLVAFVDARTPLLVADEHGVRIRLGQAWQGLPWEALAAVRHRPRTSWWRDGVLALEPVDPDHVLAEADGGVRRRAWISQRLHGASLAVPLGLATRTLGGGEELTASLRRLAQGATPVLEVGPVGAPAESGDEPSIVDDGAVRNEEVRIIDGAVPAARDDSTESVEAAPVCGAVAFGVEADDAASNLPDDDIAPDDALVPGPSRDDAILDGAVSDTQAVDAPVGFALRLRRGVAGFLGGHRRAGVAPTADVEPDGVVDDVADAPDLEPVEPARPVVHARRSDHLQETAQDDVAPVGRELRREGRVSLVEESAVAEAVTFTPLDLDAADESSMLPEPVIGPVLTRARERIGLTVDALADRTRIRPHVIEAIERDDFVPCGGDFYARGHLRTLGRVLGLEPGPLVKLYDERYADAPINARKVFEAELASGTGGIRAVRGGPNWSVVVAAVMAVVLAWSVAKLAIDDKPEPDGVMSLSQGSGGPNGAVQSERVTVKVTATSTSRVEVRNAKGKLVFAEELAAGNIHRIDALPPVQVKATDGGAIEVEIDNVPQGTVGKAGQPGKKKFAN